MSNTDRFSKFAQTDGIRANLKQKSIRGAVFMAGGNSAELVIRVLAIAVLARLLLPEEFGLIAMVTALTSILDGFRDFGLSAATVQRPDISHQQVSNLFWVNVSVGILLALLFSSAAPLIAAFYHDQRLVGVSIALAFVFIWNGFAVQHEALMTRQLRQGELALIRLIATVISVLIAIVLAVAGWGFWALVAREISRSVLVTSGAWLRCPWIPGRPSRNVGTRGLVRFGGEVSVTHLLASLIGNVDRLLIGRYFGASLVGMYRQAQQLVLVPVDQLQGPIIGVAQPALSALQRDPERYRRYYERIVFLVTLATFPLGVFIAVCSEDVTLLLLGPDWIDATIFVQIFGIATAVRPAIGSSAVVLITCGLSTRFLALAIIHSLVLVVMLIVGLNWGATGVASALVATTFMLAIPKLYYSFLGTPATLRGFFLACWVPATAGVAMGIVLIALDRLEIASGTFASLLLSAAVGAATYMAAIALHPGSRAILRALFVDIGSSLRAKLQTSS
jgi:PST family polysaccharide transporter